MQYALIQLKKDFLHLISAEEMQIMDEYGDNVEDTQFDEDNVTFKIAYGALLPSHSERFSIGDGIDFISKHEDYFYSYIKKDKCILFGIKKFILGQPVILGKAWKIPFACLMEVDDKFELTSSKTFSNTCFLRKSNLSPMTNILNRECVLAIHSEEKRIAKDATVDASNWKSFVELERINKVAMKIN